MTVQGAFRSMALTISLVALAGCGGSASKDAETTDAAAGAAGSGRTATATLRSTSGSSVTGTITFSEEAGGVRVFAMLQGMAPGQHGFHIHETGDCSAPDGSSAGGHFNPASVPHGGPDAAEHHAGDLGNITADEAGNAHYEEVIPHVTLDDGPNSIVGRAVVVHADPDDMTSQPAGNAGPRIACGVIVGANH
jgi:Cu-Zn family superoxide dismutase